MAVVAESSKKEGERGERKESIEIRVIQRKRVNNRVRASLVIVPFVDFDVSDIFIKKYCFLNLSLPSSLSPSLFKLHLINLANMCVSLVVITIAAW